MRASLRLLVLSASCVLGLLTVVGATTVTIDAEKNDCPIDMGQKAVAVKLTPGEWHFRLEGQIYYGTSSRAHERPCGEVLLNVDPIAVRSMGDAPVALLRVSIMNGCHVSVRHATTAYLFLADRRTEGNSGSVEVTAWHGDKEYRYRVDAVRNCYELELDHRAVGVTLRPGCYTVTLKRSTLEYADRAVPLEDQPDQVLIDCNQELVGTIGEGGENVGTWVLSAMGDTGLLGVEKQTVLRFYFAHSKARAYRGKLTVTIQPYTMEEAVG